MASAPNSIDVKEALRWLSTIGVREPSSLVHRELDVSVKAVANKSFKERDEKEEKLSSQDCIIFALYGGCPSGGVLPMAGAQKGRLRCHQYCLRAEAKSLASHRLQRGGQLHSSSQMNRCISLPASYWAKQKRSLRDIEQGIATPNE